MGTQGAHSELMLDFAAQAFQAKNFQLACEIYERQLQERQAGGADWGLLLLRRAQCLACSGKLHEAFDVYQEAARHTELGAEHMDTLVSCLAEQLRSRREPPPPPRSARLWGLVSCRECQSLLYEPVTLPCGHTVCRRCLDSGQCRQCRASLHQGTGHNYRVNVVLSNVISKWFPYQLRAGRMAQDGSALLTDNRLQEALDAYNEAIKLVPLDHLLYSQRSMVYLSLKSYELALEDAETACKLQPNWLKGHLRKAQMLTNLGKIEEALKEFLFCLLLDNENKTAKSEAQKLLLNILSPGHSQRDFPDVLQMMLHQSRLKGSLISSDVSINRLYRTNMDYKKNVILPEQTIPTGCSTVRKSLQTLENMKDSHSRDTLSSEDNLKTSRICNTLKRKLCNNDTSDVTGPEMTSKLPKSDLSVDESTDVDLPFSLPVDSSDLECSLCMRLLYEPVTTPCGHTYCLKCLERCLDHNPKCPLCKEDLCEYLAVRKFCKTELMEDLIAKYFPEELKERKTIYEEEIAELSNLNKNVPIFVCTMAYPTVPCPLHIFEPCYRLMIRRCMETGTKQFGMCIGDSVKGFADYGCMLEIRNVEFFADGRSVVDSIGKRRFKVIQHSQRDGYNTADIEYIEDEKVKEEDYEELRTLHNAVYDQAYNWFSTLKLPLKTRILSHFGAMPAKDSDLKVNPNGPAWCWWILAVLPLESRAQLPFLAMTSLKDRLTSIRRVLLFMCRSRTR